MRKLSCILLLAVLAFNWVGYSAFISLMEYQADASLQASVDAGKYDASQLVEIKLPMQGLPYYSNSSLYERKDGRLEIDGMELNFVKARIHNDSLEILCIANSDAVKLRDAQNDYFKQTNDVQTNAGKSSGTNSVAKYFPLGNYTTHEIFELGEMHVRKLKKQFPYCCVFPLHYTSVIENPPDNC